MSPNNDLNPNTNLAKTVLVNSTSIGFMNLRAFFRPPNKFPMPPCLSSFCEPPFCDSLDAILVSIVVLVSRILLRIEFFSFLLSLPSKNFRTFLIPSVICSSISSSFSITTSSDVRMTLLFSISVILSILLSTSSF